LEGVIFGADDYADSIGAIRTEKSLEMILAR